MFDLTEQKKKYKNKKYKNIDDNKFGKIKNV